MSGDSIPRESGLRLGDPRPLALADAVRAAAGFAVAVLPWLLSALGMAAAFAQPWGADVTAILAFAREWVRGATLYRDLVDVNPPLIFLLSAPVAAAADLTGLHALHLWNVCVAGFALWNLRLARRLLPLLGGHEGWVTAMYVAVVPFLLLGFPLEHFGQREHLLLAGLPAYLVLAAVRAEGRHAPPATTVRAVVLAAAVCVAIKPFFVVLPLAVEGYLLLRRGWRRTLADRAPWLFAGTGLAYLAVVLVFFPLYLGEAVPFARAAYVSGDGLHQFVYVLLRPGAGGLLALLLASAAVAAIAFSRQGSELARVTAAAAAAGVLVGLLQGKGFAYHALPAQTLLLVAAIVALREALRGAAVADGRPLGLLLLCLAIGLCATSRATPWAQLTYATSPAGRVAAEIRAHAQGGAAMVLSSGIQLAYPAIPAAGATPANRFMSLHYLHFLYGRCEVPPLSHGPAERPWAEAYILDGLVQDMLTKRPAVIVASRDDGQSARCAPGYDYIAWLRTDPAFDAAFAGYTLAKTIGRNEIWVRGGSSDRGHGL